MSADEVRIGCPCADPDLERALTGWARITLGHEPVRGDVVLTGEAATAWRFDGTRWCEFVQGRL